MIAVRKIPSKVPAPPIDATPRLYGARDIRCGPPTPIGFEPLMSLSQDQCGQFKATVSDSWASRHRRLPTCGYSAGLLPPSDRRRITLPGLRSFR
jgi:hypothetical protein